MRKWYTLILVSALILGICHKANGINASIKKKYPNVLLTDDYGILNENDLASHTWEVKPYQFSAVVEDRPDYNYWQCFPREWVTITLEDKGYSTEDIGLESNCSDITITAWSDGITHVYFMRRYMSIDSAEKIFNHWQKLMKKEKYVCLSGRFSFEQEVAYGKDKHKEYNWIFEKIKTKKGCDSYFAGCCNLTYKQFLQEQSSSYSLKKTLGQQSRM